MTTPTSSYETMNVRELKKVCKENKIVGYSKLKKHELIKHINQYFLEKESKTIEKIYNPPKPFEIMNKFELIFECKKLKIKKYSKWNKQRLIKELHDYTKKQEKNIVKTEENIFCYPEIIDTIYEYVNYSKMDIYRENIKNENNKEKFEKIQKIYEIYESLPIIEKKLYLRENGYLSKYNLQNEMLNIKVVNMKYEEIIKLKDYCYRWLNMFHYPVFKKMRKIEMVIMIKKEMKKIYK